MWQFIVLPLPSVFSILLQYKLYKFVQFEKDTVEILV